MPNRRASDRFHGLVLDVFRMLAMLHWLGVLGVFRVFCVFCARSRLHGLDMRCLAGAWTCCLRGARVGLSPSRIAVSDTRHASLSRCRCGGRLGKA